MRFLSHLNRGWPLRHCVYSILKQRSTEVAEIFQWKEADYDEHLSHNYNKQLGDALKSLVKRKDKLLRKVFLRIEISRRKELSETCNNFLVYIVGIYHFVLLLLKLTTFSTD